MSQLLGADAKEREQEGVPPEASLSARRSGGGGSRRATEHAAQLQHVNRLSQRSHPLAKRFPDAEQVREEMEIAAVAVEAVAARRQIDCAYRLAEEVESTISARLNTSSVHLRNAEVR